MSSVLTGLGHLALFLVMFVLISIIGACLAEAISPSDRTPTVPIYEARGWQGRSVDRFGADAWTEAEPLKRKRKGNRRQRRAWRKMNA
jgi:hypothetical protein